MFIMLKRDLVQDIYTNQVDYIVIVGQLMIHNQYL